MCGNQCGIWFQTALIINKRIFWGKRNRSFKGFVCLVLRARLTGDRIFFWEARSRIPNKISEQSKAVVLSENIDSGLCMMRGSDEMTIPAEILSLIEQLTQEIDRIEQQANKGLAIASQLLERFPNNARLIGLSANLGNAVRSPQPSDWSESDRAYLSLKNAPVSCGFDQRSRLGNSQPGLGHSGSLLAVCFVAGRSLVLDACWWWWRWWS